MAVIGEFLIVAIGVVLLPLGVKARNSTEHQQCTGQNPQPRTALFIMSSDCEAIPCHMYRGLFMSV